MAKQNTIGPQGVVSDNDGRRRDGAVWAQRRAQEIRIAIRCQKGRVMQQPGHEPRRDWNVPGAEASECLETLDA